MGMINLSRTHSVPFQKGSFIMEFHEKLQELRKQKGLTQEQLAASLYVSRTAISKWESGRGYPNIDSLKALAAFFGITIDELLSGEKLLTIAEADVKRQGTHLRDLVYGLLDLSAAMFFFLPFFGCHEGDLIQAVSLLSLTGIAAWLHTVYFVVVICMVLTGILTLALQNLQAAFWAKHRHHLSVLLNALGTLIFIVSLQPYAAAFLFIHLLIKAFLLLRRP